MENPRDVAGERRRRMKLYRNEAVAFEDPDTIFCFENFVFEGYNFFVNYCVRKI